MGACLSSSLEDKDETVQLFAAGWGMTERRNKSPEQLMQVNLTTVPIDKCREQYKQLQNKSNLKKREIYDTQYCAIGKLNEEMFYSDTCQGDSGGPLFYEENIYGVPKYILVGIISYGINCMRDIPGVYVRVAPYLDWMASEVWPFEVCDEPFH
ncbi:hypothetical protein ZHAS_00004606 [Anopheles sinensis]|uniref:Peptidase S1 domain-containing protein n=1 Tax=Anopheles sinensis TaxID=74873 RepID=A0A084VHM5_ANOSI|nr:hypothetical protein ZHAS_00004606 [Anopheles sinensis]